MLATPTLNLNTLRQSTPPQLIRLVLLLGLLLLAAVTFVAAAFQAFEYRETPFLGVTMTHNMVVNAGRPNSDTPWNGQEAGLETGDQLTHINGQPIIPIENTSNVTPVYLLDVLDEVLLGQNVRVDFLRPATNGLVETEGAVICEDVVDGVATCSVNYQLQIIPQVDFLAMFITPFASGLVGLVMMAIIVYMRPTDPKAFTLVVSGTMLAIYMATFFDAGTTHQFVPLWYTSGILASCAIVTIGLIFPKKLPFIHKQPLLRFVPLALYGLLLIYVLTTYPNEGLLNGGAANRLVGVLGVMSLLIMAALMFLQQRPRATTAASRDQASTIFLGTMLGLAPGLYWLLVQLVVVLFDGPAVSFSIELAMPFFITPIVAITYAALRERENSSDAFISIVITYSIMFVALLIGYFMLVLGASLITTGALSTGQSANPIVILVTIFFVSLLFTPVRTRLQQRIDSIYFRKRKDYQQQLEEFSSKLTSLPGVDVMINEFRSVLSETVQPTSTLIFLLDPKNNNYIAHGKQTDIVFGSDSGVVKMLRHNDTSIYLPPGEPWPGELQVDRARLGIIKVMVLSGMVGTEQLNGFVAIGPPRSGMGSYEYEKLRFIHNLVGQLSIAVENAQVITSLESRVRELNVLSQVGQAVNFTIDPDDLLELISAQTLRLIEAPYFYIVLHETTTDQMYYAFFQENDDRKSENEDKKWPIGQDIYSEVMRAGRPRLMNDYRRVIEQKNYRYTGEAQDIRSWMGVPLSAGKNTLGVMALATPDTINNFTEEQLNIFTNIGSLAATAIDKARLFTETNTRAHQLGVLNSISQRLVASEGDVEGLLDLITQSAVEILNAEAGSLLLTIEQPDGTPPKELEFKSSIGGTGHELLGTRLPIGHGIVGEVAQTGKPLIVNDISTNEHWKGDIVQEFHTNSILAVPLVAKEKVIGVLEILNKKDGSVYLDDDKDLLATFAGQAAIALENARLLQQTDLQLSQRVQQLETLESIDKELNRTRDIARVAQITLRWAIANTGAEAGLVGIIEESPPQMKVIARYGYDEGDQPEGAFGDLWPIDTGIVGRVVRSRRPDLQPDVTIDPDYIPSMKNALSQITVPMLSGNDLLAVLVLETIREPRFNLLDLDWVQRITEHAAIAIANAQFFMELTRAADTKSEFIGFAAHELKNPLTSVKGYAGTITNPDYFSQMSTDQLQGIAGIILKNADRMQSIIDDLRDIARSDAGKLTIDPRPVALREVIEETVIPYEQQIIDKGQTFINDASEDLPMIHADKEKLIQILTNFISNAHKYGKEGGFIRVGARVNPRHMSRKNQLMGEMMHIWVQDDGIGMSGEDLGMIFQEDYFRSENREAREQKGTGLGMIITGRLIEAHGGEVWVESTLGEGSTFNFVIPLAPTEADTDPSHTQEMKAAEPASD